MKALRKVDLQVKPDEIIIMFRTEKKSVRARPLVVNLSNKEIGDEIISN
jgi:hypothetical protein